MIAESINENNTSTAEQASAEQGGEQQVANSEPAVAEGVDAQAEAKVEEGRDLVMTIQEPQADKAEQKLWVKNKKSLDFSYTQNRELSWLQFNRRVLEEALDKTVPLYERLKFIAIFESNLDEFFMVRVGSLTDLMAINADTREDKSNMSACEQIDAVLAATKPLIKLRDKIYKKIMEELKSYGVEELDLNAMSKREQKFVRDFYKEYLKPILSPQVIDQRHPFPHLRNKDLYIAMVLTDDEGGNGLGIVPVPDNAPRIVVNPENPLQFVRLEQIVAYNADKLFGIYKASNPVVVSVTRNADISFDEEKFADDEGDYRLHISNLLKKRNRLNPVRLEIEGKPDKALVAALLRRLKLNKEQVFVSTSPIDLSWVFGFERKLAPALKSELCYPPFAPRVSHTFESDRSIICQVEEHDRVLFYPYDSIEQYLRMLQEAAVDPTIVSIKITLYRLASDSRVAQHLIEAAENGKDVTVLMELRARFDEANNIDWSERLEQAGCNIIYGMENYKCHSKICLITKREGDKLVNITQIGTGNYNEKTAKLYTDICLFTADEEIGRDAVNFFQNMLIGNLNGAYERLLVAPANMKQTLLSLVDREIEKGSEGRISIKANSVTDRNVIDKLAEASQAGVHVRMNIRGICCLVPGVEGKTDNINVRSIVGQFLEHSRVFCFGSGDDMVMYIASADLMTRNLVHRVEVACPIVDPDIQKAIWLFMEKIFEDNTKARSLQPSGEFLPVSEGFDSELFAHEGAFCLHNWCVAHPMQRQELAKGHESNGVRRPLKRPEPVGQPAVKPQVAAKAKPTAPAQNEAAQVSEAPQAAAPSSSSLPPVGKRNVWQRIKAVFLGD